MKANPGGQIAIEAVIGRNSLVQQLWDTIEVQSLRMTAERRIGKTTLLRVMLKQPRDNWVPVFQDLEDCHSAADFAMSVYKEVHQFLSKKGKAARRCQEFFKALGGVEIGGVFKLPATGANNWKDVLTKAVEDLVHENDANGTKLLFLWDEMPFMLANIRDKEGERAAMEVLDVLRSLRQTHNGLRMIITGSIGLHHVLGSLKDKGYANAPFNDMASIEVPPLDYADACKLARQLILGEALVCEHAATTDAAIATLSDRFPFYIHHIVRALKSQRLPATPESVEAVVAHHMIDANDPWELLHYRDRLLTYYGKQSSTAALILDDLAATRTLASATELLTMLKGSSHFDDREQLLRLLTLMERDHYLERTAAAGHYQFRFPLIRRWWKINRSL